MKILVLGGCGIQGRTALYDLASDEHVKEIICADIRFDELSKIKDFTDMSKIKEVRVDAKNKDDLINLYKKVDVVIDLLPRDFNKFVNEAALEAKVSVVNTNYAYFPEQLDESAKKAGMINVFARNAGFITSPLMAACPRLKPKYSPASNMTPCIKGIHSG